MTSVRIYDEADLGKIRGFIAANQSPLNLGRNHGWGDGGDCHWLAAERDDGTMVGVAAIFRCGKDRCFRETGATRIILNGYNIQKTMLLVRTIHETVLNPGFTDLYCSTREINAQSRRLFATLELEPWPDPPQYLRDRRIIPPDMTDQLLFFRIPAPRAPVFARKLLDLERQGRLRPKRGGTVLPVTLDLAVLRNRRDDVIRLAADQTARPQ